MNYTAKSSPPSVPCLSTLNVAFLFYLNVCTFTSDIVPTILTRTALCAFKCCIFPHSHQLVYTTLFQNSQQYLLSDDLHFAHLWGMQL